MKFKLNSYLDAIALCNNLQMSDLKEWFFYPGMLLGSSAKWWADFGVRPAEHEGLDIYMYKNHREELAWLDQNTRIPAMAKGVVANICNDFLGQSVIIEHKSTRESENRQNFRILSVYAHLSLSENIYSGMKIQENDIVGQIADTSGKRSGIPSHVHISIMEISEKITADLLNWELFGKPDSDKVKFFNPWLFT